MMGERVFGESGARSPHRGDARRARRCRCWPLPTARPWCPWSAPWTTRGRWTVTLAPTPAAWALSLPIPFYTPEVASQCMDTIFRPTIEAMAAEGRPFCGCLYFGLMLTPAGAASVIEYNCRFGDPETQAVLPLLEGDLLDIMRGHRRGPSGRCAGALFRQGLLLRGAGLAGLPGEIPDRLCPLLPAPRKDVSVFVAGAKLEGERLVTSGGRVVGRERPGRYPRGGCRPCLSGVRRTSPLTTSTAARTSAQRALAARQKEEQRHGDTSLCGKESAPGRGSQSPSLRPSHAARH